MIVYTDDAAREVARAIDELKADRTFILSDTNVFAALRVKWPEVTAVHLVPAGESSKSIDTACELWQWLADNGATRRSLLINIGGGVVTDLGGFVAATFKRGIRFVNVPTTLLAVADAAIGGKTGIDFNGLKNEVGAFALSERVIIAPSLLATLPDAELRSGFAEVVKTALISDADVYAELLVPDALYDREVLGRAMRHAASYKEEVVARDLREGGLRRILNFGHTAGHAYEEYAAMIGKPISHGEAVAHGMLYALRLSNCELGLDAKIADEYEEKILRKYYNPLPFGKEADAEIARLMTHDKKNIGDGRVNFVLLRAVGVPVY